MTRYELFLDDRATRALAPRVVMRWRNVTRGDQGEALLVLWPHEGRPVAMATLYSRGKTVAHEFDSLSRENKLIARETDQLIWAPSTPGLSFKPIPDAPNPANTPGERLLQMKTMAGRFKATLTGWKPDDAPEVLRLLLRQLYRHELDAREREDILDGALFALMSGRNRDVFPGHIVSPPVTSSILVKAGWPRQRLGGCMGVSRERNLQGHNACRPTRDRAEV